MELDTCGVSVPTSHRRQSQKGKKPPRRPRSRWEDNITIDLQEIGLG
jgi:hypothetical protein